MSGQMAMKLSAKTPALQTITLTPEKATELLEHNQLNRPLSDQHVKRIAAQIISGKWRFNGDTIKIASTGDVLDGQHRLWAVIEAKKAVDTVLVRGIDREAFSTIDTLRKPRSGSDVIALSGHPRHRQITAMALTWLLRWQKKCLEDYKAPQHRIENSDIEQAFADNAGILRAVEEAQKLRGLANASLLAFFYYVLTNRNPDLAERLLTTLHNPAGVALSDPFFRLRSYFTNNTERRKEPLITIALMIKAANAAHLEQKMQTLSWKSQGNSPEAFPILKV